MIDNGFQGVERGGSLFAAERSGTTGLVILANKKERKEERMRSEVW